MTDPMDPERKRRTAAEQHGAVAYEEHLRADRERFERRRQEIRDTCAELLAERIEADLGSINDPEMVDYVEGKRRELEIEWAAREARQLEKIDREERERLERTRALYDR